ncbi:MAG: hypothetical protein HC800_25205 [Phormidesmis sp. RL_2_1]|nr:hypothetical protein [Phormidesmis sp. RL_2_1]
MNRGFESVMEPIAIIGIGCRFPQANNPQTFWQLLKMASRPLPRFLKSVGQ